MRERGDKNLVGGRGESTGGGELFQEGGWVNFRLVEEGGLLANYLFNVIHRAAVST